MKFFKNIFGGAKETPAAVPLPTGPPVVSATGLGKPILKAGTTIYTVCPARALPTFAQQGVAACSLGLTNEPLPGTKFFKWEPYGLLWAPSPQDKHASFPVVLEIVTQEDIEYVADTNFAHFTPANRDVKLVDAGKYVWDKYGAATFTSPSLVGATTDTASESDPAQSESASPPYSELLASGKNHLLPPTWVKSVRVPWAYSHKVFNRESIGAAPVVSDKTATTLAHLFGYSQVRYLFRVPFSNTDAPVFSGLNTAVQRSASSDGLLPKFAFTDENVDRITWVDKNCGDLIAKQSELLDNTFQTSSVMREVMGALPSDIRNSIQQIGMLKMASTLSDISSPESAAKADDFLKEHLLPPIPAASLPIRQLKPEQLSTSRPKKPKA